MSPIKVLEDALSAGKDFGSLAGRLRDKFKSSTADLQAIYDEAESVIDSAVAKAKDGLAAFKAEVEKVEGDVKGVEEEIPGIDKPETTAPEITVGGDTTFHKADDGVVTALSHISGEVQAFTSTGEVVEPKPEVVQTVVQATVDAGVAVPDALTIGADVQAPVAQPVI